MTRMIIAIMIPEEIMKIQMKIKKTIENENANWKLTIGIDSMIVLYLLIVFGVQLF